MGQKNNIGRESNARQKDSAFHWIEVVFYLVLLAAIAAGIFLYFKCIVIPAISESKPIENPAHSYVTTGVGNLDVDRNDRKGFSFNYKKEMVETKENVNVKTVLLYVYLVSMFLILLLFLFLVINRIDDRVVLHKKLRFLNERYEDAKKRYIEKPVPLYERYPADKAEGGKGDSQSSGTLEKNYPDMKELFKAYSNALLEL